MTPNPHGQWRSSKLDHLTIIGNADVIVAQFAVITEKHVDSAGTHDAEHMPTVLDVYVSQEMTEVFSRTDRWRPLAMIGGDLRDLRSAAQFAR